MDSNETMATVTPVESTPAPVPVPTRLRNNKPTEDTKQLLKAANLKIKELEAAIIKHEEEKELLLQKNEILFKDNVKFKRDATDNDAKFNHLKTSLMNSLQTTADLIQLFK